MKRRTFLIVTVLLISGTAFLNGCSQFNTTSIGKLLEDPRSYEGKTVTVEGRVTDTKSLFVVKYFTVEDKTGKIVVVTDRMLPRVGQTDRVRGKLDEAFSIGQTRMIVLVEESAEK